MSEIGVVVIGRNEGERLRRCLQSLAQVDGRVVYVDSGSSDRSVATARSCGAEVVALQDDAPFTAARARNAGFDRLLAIDPSVEFVQFIDGDCEVRPDWIANACLAIKQRPDVAIVFGRRLERFPDASIYNRLCDMEWDTAVGEATECGGDALMRAAVLREAGGYDARMIAGEEPELCVRVRARGWKILRIDAQMTVHDAAMTRFGQWWRRNIRNGHAFAEGCAMHGASPARHWVRQTRSNWIWGFAVPTLAVALAWPTWGLSVLLAIAFYVLLAIRIFRYCRKRGRCTSDSVGYAAFCVLGKFAQSYGQLKYRITRFLGRHQSLIEYKGTNSSTHVMAGRA
jgi:GT2 family glycosyltransferase